MITGSTSLPLNLHAHIDFTQTLNRHRWSKLSLVKVGGLLVFCGLVRFGWFIIAARMSQSRTVASSRNSQVNEALLAGTHRGPEALVSSTSAIEGRLLNLENQLSQVMANQQKILTQLSSLRAPTAPPFVPYNATQQGQSGSGARAFKY